MSRFIYRLLCLIGKHAFIYSPVYRYDGGWVKDKRCIHCRFYERIYV